MARYRIALALGCAVAVAASPAAGARAPAQSWALRHVHAPRSVRTIDRPVVAVVDSGVDARIPALRGRVLPGIDFVAGGVATRDPFGHGTEVAALVAGGGPGRLGVAPSTLVLPVRVLDARGRGDADRLATGIRWAADHGARVINVSAVSSVDWRALADAVAYASSRDALVVAAAGDGVSVAWPAAYDRVIAVGAVDTHGRRGAFSPLGDVDIVAPGVRVPTVLSGHGGRTVASGTSFAAPLVSGAAALLLACDPALSNTQLEALLVGSARDLGQAGVDSAFGAGMLDAGAAYRSGCTPAGVRVRPPPA